MPSWILKAALQKGLSLAPGGKSINALLWRYVTRGGRLTDVAFTDKLVHASRHLNAWEQHRVPGRSLSVLELGTGWYPIVPVALWLAGADRVTTIDLHSHCKPEYVRAVLDRFSAAAGSGELAHWIQVRPERLQGIERASTSSDPLDELPIRYLVGNAAELADPDGCFSLIVSNNVLEHIEPSALRAILRNFRRLLRPDGIASHLVDMSDHLSHFDHSISAYHFLRYSPRAWRWIDNDIHPQNRLRMPDYREILLASDYQIVDETRISEDAAALAREPVDSSFAHVTPDELAVSHVHYVLRPRGASAHATEGPSQPG